ncbi:MAG: 2-dehydropantoate 2-reductase [Burkholderiales bacterium]|jgi:2-dehydropantoate 2-reductase|nr:2-dehydropantoate 2-reductase [Burkholderiales bacterium]
MKVLVYGAGAIGGYLGAILTAAGEDVTLVARGAQYDALSSRGILLEGPRSGRPDPIKVRVCKPGEEKPPYDVIFVTLKSQQIAEAARHLRGLVAKDGVFVFPQNGIPWWYFQGIESKFSGKPLKTLDPDGVLMRSFEPRMIIGGTALKPADLVEPGRIRLPDADTDALVIGEIDNSITPRVQAIAAMTTRAGWNGKVSDDVRKVKWTKLTGNAVWNSLGAITQSTGREAAEFPGTRPLAMALMREVIAVAAAVGTKLDADPEAIVDGVAKRVSLPTSTLQDVRAGRPLEMDAIVNVVLELGEMTGVATPSLAVVAACVNLLNQRISVDGVAIRTVKRQE